MSPNGLTPRVAREIASDRLRVAEHHRLVIKSRAGRAARRAPFALLSRPRPAGRQAVAEPADA